MDMNRRQFINATLVGTAGTALATSTSAVRGLGVPLEEDTAGPYMIEIISPPEEKVRELPIFDSYKQAENFAQARMHILRQQRDYDGVTGHLATAAHEAGLIRVWASNKGTNHVIVFECAWGETWTQATSYVDVSGRRS
jgi:hypothetical protein